MERRGFLSLMIAGLGLGTVPALADTKRTDVSLSKTPGAWIGDSVPSVLASQMLAEGREIYGDLQVAQTAVVDRDIPNLRLALSDARRGLNVLGTPPAVRALLGQLSIVEHDLDAPNGSVDPIFWETFKGEVKDVVAAAPKIGAEAGKEIQAASLAMTSGEAAAARDHVAALRSILEYRYDVFPLERAQEDVASAWRMASMEEPLPWNPIAQAMDSATAHMRWLTRPRAQGLLTAYFAIARAESLWPGHEAEARSSLRQAAACLSEQPDAGPLAASAKSLVSKRQLDPEDMGALIDGIRRQVSREQQRATAG